MSLTPVNKYSKKNHVHLLSRSAKTSKKNFAKNLNTFFGVSQNTLISSYVENIFTETPNKKFDVSVNIFSTYEEMEPLRFGSKIEHPSF